ncbi:MAG: transporter substrate-binding domain-containing protein [Eubacteriales bacterium]|nr:transporter substrate-binding domain-containing protein [Eubacteriales bacterium]
MKKFISLALVVVLALTMSIAFTGCGKDEDKLVEEPDALVVGITVYEPMNYQAKDGSWTGFDTEFAQAVCEKLGYEPEFVEIDWDNKFLELDSESIDCIWNGMTITDEVKKNADVSKAYVKNAQVVVMTADKADSIKSVEDLKGLKFAAEAGSAGETAIKDNKLDADYAACATQTDALLEVKSGSVDACVIDITMANAMTGKGTSYSSLAPAFELTTEEYGIAFRKGSDLTEKVNKVMDELKADGTLDKLAKKYNLTLAF